jgi:UPF0271 protein
LKGICESVGGKLHHVKPHGAMYNQAAKDVALAAAIADAVKAIDPKLVFYGGSGSALVAEAEKIGLRTASEVFADRTYQPDGSLTPRSAADALIKDPRRAVEQALQLVTTQSVTAVTGEKVNLKPDTICIHGDGDHALEFAVAMRQAFSDNGISVEAV